MRDNHGHSKGGQQSRLYMTWNAMKQRCSNPNNAHYADYGGRGIFVCERWQTFSNFAEDMGPRPLGHLLDRIDNAGGYEPGNVRWATHVQSIANRRSYRGGLTRDQVQEIHGRCEHGESQRSVGRRFGIRQSYVSLIRSGARWPDMVRA